MLLCTHRTTAVIKYILVTMQVRDTFYQDKRFCFMSTTTAFLQLHRVVFNFPHVLCTHDTQIFLYISTDKKVIGCIFAEKISQVHTHIYQVIVLHTVYTTPQLSLRDMQYSVQHSRPHLPVLAQIILSLYAPHLQMDYQNHLKVMMYRDLLVNWTHCLHGTAAPVPSQLSWE